MFKILQNMIDAIKRRIHPISIELVFAYDDHYAIGLRDGLPWPHKGSDMRNFKSITTSEEVNVVIVGNKTYRSLPKSLLPGRHLIVLTRGRNQIPRCGEQHGCTVHVAFSAEQAISIARNLGARKVFVAGGAKIYALFWPYANVIHSTEIVGIYAADTYLPDCISSTIGIRGRDTGWDRTASCRLSLGVHYSRWERILWNKPNRLG